MKAENIQGLINIYENEIKMLKTTVKRLDKCGIHVAARIAEQAQTTYERVVEDINRMQEEPHHDLPKNDLR